LTGGENAGSGCEALFFNSLLGKTADRIPDAKRTMGRFKSKTAIAGDQ
jgi:hypothetical protein